MTQQILEKLNNQISQLQAETGFLRSFVIGILGKDKEGEYRSDFVKKALKANQKDSCACFESKKSFLEKLHS